MGIVSLLFFTLMIRHIVVMFGVVITPGFQGVVWCSLFVTPYASTNGSTQSTTFTLATVAEPAFIPLLLFLSLAHLL